MRVQCLLWDFGDTLCDELSLWRASPEWMEIYRSFDDGIGAAWSAGELDTRGFGESQPAYSNDTKDGRAGNRRTELSRLM